MLLARLKRLIVGEPIASKMARHQRIPKWKALAVLSSDALSSVAYATEEILIPLAVFGAQSWSLPIAGGIVLLLLILTLSYRQTIDAYPSGGGAYIVAKENLGTYAGLVAGASLLIDYVLTVAVSTASGVENIVSAIPELSGYKEVIGCTLIFILMILNLRGVRDSASIFALPTYFFILVFGVLIIIGFVRGSAPYQASAMTFAPVPLFLLLRAFASGCAALTGVEAISNGIPVFEEPSCRNAKITLGWMSFTLGALFFGVTLLAHVYNISVPPGETAVSVLGHAIFGQSPMYYVLEAATALILILAANTSYADFPRLSSLLAQDRYLPRQLAGLGDRLVFSNGIIGLSLAAMLLIVFFRGDTHLLIPLYAIGVFLSFTLSQAGMVLHHVRCKQKGWVLSCFYNALGAITTLIVLFVLACTKFFSGAWMILISIPFCVFIFKRIRSHYDAVGRELSLVNYRPESTIFHPVRHTVIIPVSGMHQGVLVALRYARSLAHDIRACYVAMDGKSTEHVRSEWDKWAHDVPLIVLESPYRSVVTPLIEYIDQIDRMAHTEFVTVIIPEFVPAHWWQQILHNQTAFMLRAALLFRPRKVVTSVRYHLKNT